MTVSTSKLSDREIGERLRTARQIARLTQAEVAEQIRIARTTLVAIEQGRRRIRTQELQELAFKYGVSVNTILRQNAIHLDLVPQFRKLPGSADEFVDQSARLLTDLVCAEIELENVLGVTRHHNYPRQRPVLSGNVNAQAEQDAHELRNWLGLGSGPVKDIVSLADLDLGIRVYQRRLDSRISGLFAYNDQVGACMLLNANHPIGRRAQTVAHELGHFTSARREPGILRTDSMPRSKEERYANSFARSFLTPARPVRQRFDELTAGQSHLTRRHVILLAQCFGVSREAMVRRIEELGLVRSGAWDWFQAHGGITNSQADEALGDSQIANGIVESYGEQVPPRLALLARESWKRRYYSEGQLAQLLRLHRLDVRQLLDGIEAEADERVELPR